MRPISMVIMKLAETAQLQCRCAMLSARETLH